MNRIADYMAGEIPDVADLEEAFPELEKKLEIPEEAPEIEDDATTNYTKDNFSVVPTFIKEDPPFEIVETERAEEEEDTGLLEIPESESEP